MMFVMKLGEEQILEMLLIYYSKLIIPSPFQNTEDQDMLYRIILPVVYGCEM
jgi:hypothetical protein